MHKEIYNLLDQNFWTQRQCFNCQKFFTLADYQTKNYQLFFKEVLKVEWRHLEVVVRLTHQQCSPFKPYSECQIEVIRDIICPIKNYE